MFLLVSLENHMSGINSLTSAKKSKSIGEKMVRWLFREHDSFPFSFLESLQLLSAVVFIPNSALFDDLFKQLSLKIELSSNDTSLSDEAKEMIIYNALCYLAFSDPKENATLKIDGVNYAIEKIQLTSGWLSGPYYAYGLKATDESRLPDGSCPPSIIIFKGSTFPTDGGFLAGYLADTRPHGTVGAQLYSRGQERLQSWINTEYERTKKTVICTGQSLGGAMSLHCHIHQPNKVDFFAINPPSLTSREKRIYNNSVNQLMSKTATTEPSRLLKVLSHRNDWVFPIGSNYFPNGTMISRHGQKKDDIKFAHVRAADPQFLQEFKPHDNKIKRNVLWKILKPLPFLVVLLLHAIALPFRFVIKLRQMFGEYYNPVKPKIENKPEINNGHKVESRVHDLCSTASIMALLGSRHKKYEAGYEPNSAPKFKPSLLIPLFSSSHSSSAEASQAPRFGQVLP